MNLDLEEIKERLVDGYFEGGMSPNTKTMQSDIAALVKALEDSAKENSAFSIQAANDILTRTRLCRVLSHQSAAISALRVQVKEMRKALDRAYPWLHKAIEGHPFGSNITPIYEAVTKIVGDVLEKYKERQCGNATE